MRKELKEIEHERKTFRGEFVKYGYVNRYKGFDVTILLKNIRTLDGMEIADHLWFKKTKGFANLGVLEFNDTIQFDARSEKYQKGRKGKITDYRLTNPSRIKKILINRTSLTEQDEL